MKTGRMTTGWMKTARFLSLFLLTAIVSPILMPKLCAAAETPRRIVSIHLCADQVALALAHRERIVSLSYLSTDPSRSHMAEAAKGIRLNTGTAEEVVALRPDLVLAGFKSARTTVASLRSLGYRVVELAFATDFDAIRAQIRRVARLLGEIKRGESLIAGMDRRLKFAATDIPGNRPLAAIYQPMGFTSGRGSLEHTLLAAAGFENLAVRLKMGALGHLPLETLVTAKPDLLVNWLGNDPSPSLSRAGYAHPALAGGSWKIASLPNKFWACGAWYSALAVERLAAVRRSLNR
jgi:iron complex transport system substrate-binding protein